MTVVKRPSVELTDVYLYRNAIDFRKSHRGLAAIVECELGHNPFDGGCMLSPINDGLRLNVCSGKTPALCCITRHWSKTNSSGRKAMMRY